MASRKPENKNSKSTVPVQFNLSSSSHRDAKSKAAKAGLPLRDWLTEIAEKAIAKG